MENGRGRGDILRVGFSKLFSQVSSERSFFAQYQSWDIGVGDVIEVSLTSRGRVHHCDTDTSTLNG